ncbi:MAG: type II toxin-antitoxin system VapC family toxin [Syntrophales bacterium]
MIFLDTSAIYALADKADANHGNAYKKFDLALKSGESFLLHNYVLLESATLLHSRLGLQSALAFLKDARSFDTEWVDLALHQEALNEFEKNEERGISLVDCMSFVVMRRRGVKKILAFDTDFQEQGFTIY